MKIAQLMTRDVKTCHGYDMLDHAARLMWESDVGVVPVLDDEQHLTGMLTDRDVCLAAYTQGKRLDEIVTAEVMSPRPIACHAEDEPEKVLAKMRDHQVRRLPVIDDEGRVVGIISIADLVRASRMHPGGELLEALAAISRQRHEAEVAGR